VAVVPTTSAIGGIGIEIGTLAATTVLIGRTAIHCGAVTGTSAIATLLTWQTSNAASSAILWIELEVHAVWITIVEGRRTDTLPAGASSRRVAGNAAISAIGWIGIHILAFAAATFRSFQSRAGHIAASTIAWVRPENNDRNSVTASFKGVNLTAASAAVI
jgi:hypothetical protein